MMHHPHDHDHHHHGPGPDIAGLDPASSEVFAAFRKVMHLNRQLLGRMMATTGDHPGASGVLRVLAVHDGISQRDLAEHMHVSRPTVTTMLQKMEQQGLIERWDDEVDQRLTRLRLTDAGRAQAESAGELFKRYVEVTIDSLPEDDRRELGRILALLADNTAAALKDLDDGTVSEKND
jgi:DNA-binding MarR family transcriptional regulator